VDLKRRIRTSSEFLPSPWLIIGAASILALAVVILALINFRREEQYMERILNEKGAALIRSLEAGARTWMMGGRGRGIRLQTLIEETGKQEDILFITVTDRSGVILAQSEGAGIGEPLMSLEELDTLTPSMTVQSRFIRRGEQGQAFEVYKEFVPLRTGSRDHYSTRRSRPDRPEFWRDPSEQERPKWSEPAEPLGENPIIFIGMDPTPFLEARQGDLRNSLIITSTLVLLVLGGVVSLFWAQSARASHRQLLDFRALATKVVASLPVGLVVTDREGRVAYVNGVAERVMGRPAPDLVGRGEEVALPSELQAISRRLARKEAVLEEETDLQRPQGGVSPASLSGSSIVTEEGEFAGRLYVLRDLREVRELQSEIRRREKLAAIGSLAAGMAHEIRNPLSSIKGFATYLGSRFPHGSEEEEAAGIMIQETDRLNRVISELLEFARPSEIKPFPVAVEELLARSLKLIAQDAAHKGITVRSEIAEDVPEVWIDPDRFVQALLNVYLNALQAMDGEGTLTVRGALEDASTVRIEVEDTGRGIPVEDLNRVFDPYYTSKPQGTGLGLAIVHKIVEAHGGQVKVISTPGAGTTLVFLIPRESRAYSGEENPPWNRQSS
jgi:two-component system, NtrC family, sensor histidine kinase HydH